MCYKKNNRKPYILSILKQSKITHGENIIKYQALNKYVCMEKRNFELTADKSTGWVSNVVPAEIYGPHVCGFALRAPKNTSAKHKR